MSLELPMLVRIQGDTDGDGGMSRDEAHEVHVLCDCGTIECCRTELYVSDIRILLAELQRMSRPAENIGKGATAWLLAQEV